jgi:hypothetical protein
VCQNPQRLLVNRTHPLSQNAPPALVEAPGRDEARNLAVVLVDAEGKFGGIRYAPVSSVSSALREQGILDAMLAGLENRFQSEAKPTLAELTSMFDTLRHSLYLTEPKPIAVSDVDMVLESLYRAYAAPRPAGSRTVTKGAVLDRVVDTLRRRGLHVGRGQSIGDFVFDVVIRSRRKPAVIEVLSFAGELKNWSPVEHDAGHFLYALERVEAKGLAVIQPPSESGDGATKTYNRVRRWLDEAAVPAVAPSQLATTELPA